jgi:hypothetical protein
MIILKGLKIILKISEAENQMEPNPYLEELSDKIRKGIPVSFFEAIDAINYQEAIRIEKKKNSFFGRLFRFLTFNRNSEN